MSKLKTGHVETEIKCVYMVATSAVLGLSIDKHMFIVSIETLWLLCVMKKVKGY